MGIKTREDYLAAIRAMRPNIYKFGELIGNVTTHPATKRTVESHARCFDAANDPEMEKMYTTTSIFTGEKIESMKLDDAGRGLADQQYAVEAPELPPYWHLYGRGVPWAGTQ